MKINTDIWENKYSLRKRIRNLAMMVVSISAVSIFRSITNKDWIILGISCLYLVVVIPVFISYTKWEKLPPKEGNNE